MKSDFFEAPSTDERNDQILRKMLIAGATVLASLLLPATGQAGLEDRASEPVVITGEQAPRLIGAEPSEVVAFSYEGGWRQVPVQVDERKMLDYRPIRQRGPNSNGFTALGYADPDTWAEADGVPQTETASPRGTGAEIPGTTGDPKLDSDDEIAMMIVHGGNPAGGHQPPAGVIGSTLTEVKVSDPLDPDKFRYIYLFVTNSGLSQSAGLDRVSYQVNYAPPLVPDYRFGYDFGSLGDNVNGRPINPEDSIVETDRYEIGIPGRWLIDELKVKAGTASGIDILDGDKSTVGTNGCGRNELTFSRGGGGMIADIDGPVRAIRSFIGANSGTYTQRDYVFYEGLFENRTTLRVHPGINRFVVAMDLAPEASGMTYRNSLNPDGVTVDGVQDSTVAGKFDWEQFSGSQGTVTNVHRYDIDVEGTEYSSYYQDMVTPDPTSSMLCSGDDHSYGAAGPMITTPTNNTDPSRADEWPELPLSHFSGTRYTWFDGPEAGSVATGQQRSSQVDNPVVVLVKDVPDDSIDGPRPDSGSAKLGLRVKPKKLRIRPGGRGRIRVVVTNRGRKAATGVKVCFRTQPGLRRPGCRKPGKIAAGRSRVLKVNVRLKRQVRRGAVRKLTVKLTSKNGGRSTRAMRVRARH